jgi:hypothetical protein
MISSHKIIRVFNEIATGENRVGSKWRGRQREREQWINRVREGALERNGNDVG